MAQFYLIMPGQTDYKKDLAPLSIKGISEALAVALDTRLKSADIIISSPHTKALQTASIISQKTNIDIIVETELEESSTFKELLEITDDFSNCSKEEIGQLDELISLKTSIKYQNTNIYTKTEMELEESSTFKELLEITDDFSNYSKEETRQLEELNSLRNEVKNVADKYAHYNKVIIVCNARFLKTLTGAKKISPGEIFECTYDYKSV